MKVLIACESSGIVREAFRSLGHDAWSCDLQPADDGSPYHIQDDVLRVIGYRPEFDGNWDLMIAHPPCTDLAVSGAKWFPEKRADGRQQRAIDFFMKLANAKIDKICIENPVGIMSTAWRKPDQIIQPWMFGEDASKRTCLWLRGLDLLSHTCIIPPHGYRQVDESYPFKDYVKVNGYKFVEDIPLRLKPVWENQTPSGQNKLGPSEDRWKLRSKTYEGVAKAMAATWGG
jgi:hypothetical protein